MKNSWFLIIAVLLAASCAKDNDKGAMEGRNSVKFAASEVQEAPWAPALLTSTQANAQTVKLEGVEAIEALGEAACLSVSQEPFNASPFTETKGTPVTALTGSFGLYGYNYTGAWGSSAKPHLAANLELNKNANNNFYQSTIMWPAAGKTRFYAYAPYNAAAATPANAATAGVPTLTYTASNTVTAQTDLLWASRGDVTRALCPDTVGFTFNHALSAIQFKISSNSTSGVIKKITLKNIVKKGVFNLDTKAWTPSAAAADKGDFVIDLGSGANAAANAVIADGANTLLMIPQSFASTSNSSIEFSYYETHTSSVERKLTASLNNATWTKGSKMVYQLNIGSITDTPQFSATCASVKTVTWDGTGSLTFKVRSYRQITGGGSATPYQAVPWTAEVKVGGAVVNATTVFNKALSGNGLANGGEETVTVTVKKATPATSTTSSSTLVSDVTGDEFLAAQPEVGTSAAYYDLSRGEGTANCYMIHAPGYYSFSLVYGNAIAGSGYVNSAAYTSTAPTHSGKVLTTFLNHKGAAITTPYIKDSGDTPVSASIVWQDQPLLVSGITLDMSANNGNGAIKFIVDRSTIKQGNAVIAVKNAAGEIMWSWHIWVTHYIPRRLPVMSAGYGFTDISVFNYSETSPYHKGKQYDMMPYNLGWCTNVNGDDAKVSYWAIGSTTYTYPERNIEITFKQTGTTKTASVTGIKQSSRVEKVMGSLQATPSYTLGTKGNNPYYQWGRKDPILPSDGSYNNKPYYTTGTNAATDVWFVNRYYVSSIPEAIKKPYYLLYETGYFYDNLWSANNTARYVNDNPVVKTIYDPCPVGYCLPPSGAYTAFNYGLGSVEGIINVSGSFNAGWNFYCRSGKEDGTIFFPAAGYRIGVTSVASVITGGYLKDVDRGGYYWSAGPSDQYDNRGGGGWCLYFNSGNVSPQNKDRADWSYSVRPVRQ